MENQEQDDIEILHEKLSDVTRRLEELEVAEHFRSDLEMKKWELEVYNTLSLDAIIKPCITFKDSDEVREAIEGGVIENLTPNKLYYIESKSLGGVHITSDNGVRLFIPSIERDCPYLAYITQWVYCDEEVLFGND